MPGARYSQVPVKLIIDLSDVALSSHETFSIMNRFPVKYTSNVINNIITINSNYY